jgi:hypothetical protein
MHAEKSNDGGKSKDLEDFYTPLRTPADSTGKEIQDR